MYQKRKNFENMLIWMVDILCMLMSFGVAFSLRFGLIYGVGAHGDQIWQAVYMSLIYVLINVCVDFNHHFFRRGCLDELMQVMKEEAVFSVVWIVLLYLMHRTSEMSRLVFGYFIIFNTFLTFTARLCFKKYMLRIFKHSRYSSRLLLVTCSEKAEEHLKNFLQYNEWNRTLTGIVLTDRDSTGAKLEGIPVVAAADSLLSYVIYHEVDEVFIADVDALDQELLREWVSQMQQMGIRVDVNISVFDLLNYGKKTLDRVGKYAVVTFARNLFSTREIILKRTLDIAGSLVGMVLLGIAAIFIAPAIKLESPGPVIFSQIRVGKNGRKFKFYKFRSMYKDAERRKKELMAQNEVQGLMFKMEHDPRITKVGRFIRRTSLDELPQFWNVLKGDMSLVGTRPPTVDEFERYEAKHKCRLSMTPGLTGLWQISGRSDIKDFDQVVQLDMQYIDNWSITKDIKILLKTVWVVAAGKGSR